MTTVTAPVIPVSAPGPLAGGREVQTPVNWTPILLGFGGMVLGQFMALLDVQIVSSSLTQIQAGIGASADEISWVQAIYLLAEVISMPLTAYMTKLWGTRPFYLAATAAFMAASVLTGLSDSITSMVAMRALQGLAAGAMIPPIIATAWTIFPPHRRVAANVGISVAISMAPTLGPVIGGHLTELLGWRWLFLVNAPVGVVVLFLVGRYARFDKGDPTLAETIDWPGLGVMTVGLLALEYVLEEGARNNWFEAPAILWLSVLAATTLPLFIWRQLVIRAPIVSLAPFRDRNFVIGAALNFISSLGLYGVSFLVPLFLGQITGYASGRVGVAMLVSGLTMFVCGPFMARLIRAIGARATMLIGFGASIWSTMLVFPIAGAWGFDQFFWPQVLRGVGSLLGVVAAQQVTMATMPPAMLKEAAGLLSLLRNLAAAVGLAVIAVFLAHQTTSHFTDLASAFSVGNPVSTAGLDGVIQVFADGGSADPQGAGRKALGLMLYRQARVLAFGDCFVFLTGFYVVGLVLGLAAKPAPEVR